MKIPEGGHLAALSRYKDSHNGLPGNISTFGFGYSLDSALLKDLSVEGKGSYAFIPDSSFVGTVFVHALAGLLTTNWTNIEINVEPEEGVKVEHFFGGHPHIETSWGTQLRVGSLCFGQSKDFLFELGIDKPTSVTVTAKVTHVDSGHVHTLKEVVKLGANSKREDLIETYFSPPSLPFAILVFPSPETLFVHYSSLFDYLHFV